MSRPKSNLPAIPPPGAPVPPAIKKRANAIRGEVLKAEKAGSPMPAGHPSVVWLGAYEVMHPHGMTSKTTIKETRETTHETSPPLTPDVIKAQEGVEEAKGNALANVEQAKGQSLEKVMKRLNTF